MNLHRTTTPRGRPRWSPQLDDGRVPYVAAGATIWLTPTWDHPAARLIAYRYRWQAKTLGMVWQAGRRRNRP